MSSRVRSNAAQAGFSLIELMIAMLIGTFMTIAVTTLLAEAEARRRTLESVDDMEQIGNYALYQIDKLVRSAGSGFANSYALSYGCKLDAVKDGVTLLPAPTTALPKPFNGFPANISNYFRLAPVLIVHNGSTAPSDALVVMAGSAGFGEIATPFTSAPQSSQVNVTSTLGFNNAYNVTVGDLLLLADQNGSTGIAPCLVEQVDIATFTPSASSPYNTQIPLAGHYYTGSGSDVVLTSFSADGEAMNLGNPGGGNPPLFQLLGVMPANATATSTSTTNYALYSYDLLQISNPGAASIVADQVFELHALYYVDSNSDGVADAWVSADPSGSSGAYSAGGVSYDAASLMSGTTAAATALHNIKAIRVGLILRSPLKEKDTIQAATTLTLFNDLTDINGGALTYTRTLDATSNETSFRYRTIETTIPIRNNMF